MLLLLLVPLVFVDKLIIYIKINWLVCFICYL